MKENFWKRILHDRQKRRIMLLCLIALIAVTTFAAFTIHKTSDRNGQATPGQDQVADAAHLTEEDAGSDLETDTGADTETDQDYEDPAVSSDTKEKDAVQKKSLLGRLKDTLKGNDNASTGAADNPSGQDNQKTNTNRKYRVKFYTDGGSKLKSCKVKSGTNISSLPTPYKNDAIFVSWYYDKDKKKLASGNDTIQKNTKLYADYIAQSPVEGVETVNFASALDVGKDFTIKIETSDPDMDAAAVKAAITATNLTDPKQKDIINVSGANGSFVISGKNPISEDGGLGVQDGFADGSTYRIALTDERLCFSGQPQTAREYNFTTAKQQVMNIALNADMIYIPAEDVSNITSDGKHVDSLHIALYQADSNGTLGPADLTVGEFDYTKGELAVGDTVSIYAGLRPDLRTLDTPAEQNGDLAYVKITGKNGKRYSYKNADAEDVIFEPDMLPLPADADQDTAANTVTVENKYLDFSSDVYANIDLDSQTTVDVGDFLMFYTGDFTKQTGEDAATITKYGKITDVEEREDLTVITFEDTKWDDVQAAMDIYANDAVSGQELLEGVETKTLEAQIEQQALDSGFAEEAVQYLGSVALATNNFTKLSENMNLSDYQITLEDGTPITTEEFQTLAAGSGFTAECEMEDGYPKASITTKPTKLSGAMNTAAKDKGLSVKLEVKANITIGKKGSSNQLGIEVSGVFEEEVGLDLGVRSKAIWKVWGIFPYIAEYRVTANVDVLNYTGVEVNATMMTKTDDEDDDDDSTQIASKIKELIDESKKDGEDEESEEAKNNLVKRYKEMMDAESDWVRVVEQNIVDTEKYLPPPLPIIAVNAEIDFVVKMDACVSIGFDFEYQTGKRYTYTIDVFAGAVYNDEVSLLEEQYEFDFYVMGRLAVKAGLEFEFKVGLFSTDLDSVGFQAEAGAYTKLWGYFYYELKYTAGNGRSQSCSGALLIDVGAYLELGLKAQAFKDTFSTELKLLDKEWSLWTVGRQDNILDFTTEQEGMPYIKLKQHVRDTELPDYVFSMHYLDLKDGKEKDAVYEDAFDSSKPESQKNRKNFDIRMTNDKFTYDPQTNTISVHPDKEDKKLEGEMIITWIQYPLAFSSRPIQRTVSLYWDNLKDGYVIVPHTNGGSYIAMINAKYEAKVEKPADPKKQGYQFAGWYKEEDLKTAYQFPDKMPAKDVSIYAKWTANKNTPYRVEYYGENVRSGQYELMAKSAFKGTTDSYVIPEVKSFAGYCAPAQQKLKVNADGSSVLRYYYSLQKHTVTFQPGEVGGEAQRYELKYGGKIIAPLMAAKGYTFTGWDQQVQSVMGTEDLTYTARWSKNKDTAYRVEYYVQDTDGAYKLQHIYNGMATTKATVSMESLKNLVISENQTADSLYTKENAIVFENMTVNGIATENATVEGNGKTVIKLRYKRLKYKVTFALGYETEAGEKTVTQDVYYGEPIILPENIKRKGYTFKEWSIDGETPATPQEKMGTEDLTYHALWKVHTYQLKFNKNSDLALGSMEGMSFTYDQEKQLPPSTYTAEDYDFTGWSVKPDGKAEYADGAAVSNLTDEDDGLVTLFAVWQPKNYGITYYGVDGAVNTNPSGYTVETETITLQAPVRAGYTFKGWYTNEAYSGEPVSEIPKGSRLDKSFYAKWEANTDTPYLVEHYKQALDGSYVLADTDMLQGTSDTTVSADVKSYEGFEAPQKQAFVIAADGSTVVRYEYIRKIYTITLDPASGSFTDGTGESISVPYEAELQLPVPVREGYGFDGWYEADQKFTDGMMPAGNISLKAKWIAGQYGYTINHYLQKEDGSDSYLLKDTVYGTAEVDTDVEGPLKEYTGFTQPAEGKKMTIKADSAANVINYYYTRNQYKLTWDLDGGAAENYTEGSVYYGAQIRIPKPVKEGHSYTWDTEPVTVMPAEDLAYKAVWTPNIYQISLDPNGGNVVEGDLATRTITFGEAYGSLPVMEKENYTFEGWYTDKTGGSKLTETSAVELGHDHVIYAQYKPIEFTITYYGTEDAQNDNPETYNVETGLFSLEKASRRGYTFEGWYDNENLEGEEVRAVSANETGNKTFYAKWRENHYKIVYHSNEGKGYSKEQQLAYTEISTLLKNTYEREGYHFGGWSEETDGEAVYADEAVAAGLSGEDDGEVHLYAVWIPELYNIIYENMEGAENADDNPATFSVVDNVVTFHEPKGKTGYTFEGWYQDSSFEKPIEGMVTIQALHDFILYAKWSANTYTVTFDSCLGDSAATETMLMTYDENYVLPLASEMKNFAKPGYSFGGWALDKTSGVTYTDGQMVSNLTEEGNITLYAVWNLDLFSITYDLGSGGESHSNPEIYSIENDDIKLEDPVAKKGYQFLGWYAGDNKIEEIVKGTGKDFNLVAKWGGAGEFNLSYVGEEDITLKDGSQGKKLTYKVTRTIPADVVATPNIQYVYYRTVSKTAYGSTVDIDIAKDKYHFKHAGGEDVYLTFGPEDMEKTFTIEEWGLDTSADIAAGMQSGNTDRYYNVELYKVVDTIGTCEGTLGNSVSEQRILSPLSGSSVPGGNVFNKQFTYQLTDGSRTITDKGYDHNFSTTIKSMQQIVNDNVKLSTLQKAYMQKQLTGVGFRLAVDQRQSDDGYAHIRLTLNGNTLCEGKHDLSNKKVWEQYWYPNSSGYVWIGLNDQIVVRTDASGKGSDDWFYGSSYVYAMMQDNRKPQQVGVANLAFGKYKAGEQISITVIYDEVIASVSGVSLGQVADIPLTNVQYVAGKGTNALTFTATLSKDFEVTPDVNNDIKNLKPVTGTVKDVLGN